jgi:hypothetical protein
VKEFESAVKSYVNNEFFNLRRLNELIPQFISSLQFRSVPFGLIWFVRFISMQFVVEERKKGNYRQKSAASGGQPLLDSAGISKTWVVISTFSVNYRNFATTILIILTLFHYSQIFPIPNPQIITKCSLF